MSIRPPVDAERLKWFIKHKPEGYLKCLWCGKEFTHDGYPMKESWCCSKYCFDTINLNNPIMEETMNIDISSIVMKKVIEEIMISKHNIIERNSWKDGKMVQDDTLSECTNCGRSGEDLKEECK